MSRRLIIFMTYNKDGIIDEYIVYMLKQLCQVAEDVYVVSNKRYTDDERKKISFVSQCIERDNDKYDVGAYSHVISTLYDTKKIYEYDELVLINDSVFGPFYDLKSMFSEMEQRKELDFWGITKRGVSDFDGGSGVYPEHIQSYFYAFRKSMIKNNEFKIYWESIVDHISDFRSAIINYEFRLTGFFESMGFKWGTYCNCEKYVGENVKTNLSPYHYSTYELIAEQKCPFLKRKLFTGDFINKEYTDASDLRKAYRYIKTKTNYNVDLMWKYILREYNIALIMEAMQMIEVIVDENDNFDEETNGYCDNLFFYMNVYENELPYIQKKAIKDNVIINLCANSSYMGKVEELFSEEPKLGVVIPPVETYGRISGSLKKQWADIGVYKKLKEKWNIIVPVTEEGPAIHEIHGIVCRKDIVSQEVYEELISDTTGTVLQVIPLLAQQKGYYTKQIINKNYVAAELSNTYSLLSNMCKCFGESGGNYTLHDLKEEMLEEKIKNYVSVDKKIYVYGAGQLACDVLKIARKYCEIQGVLVSDKKSNLSQLEGYKVYEYSELKDRDIYIIVAVGKKNNKVVTDNLVKDGIIHIMLADW